MKNKHILLIGKKSLLPEYLQKKNAKIYKDFFGTLV